MTKYEDQQVPPGETDSVLPQPLTLQNARIQRTHLEAFSVDFLKIHDVSELSPAFNSKCEELDRFIESEVSRLRSELEKFEKALHAWRNVMPDEEDPKSTVEKIAQLQLLLKEPETPTCDDRSFEKSSLPIIEDKSSERTLPLTGQQPTEDEVLETRFLLEGSIPDSSMPELANESPPDSWQVAMDLPSTSNETSVTNSLPLPAQHEQINRSVERLAMPEPRQISLISIDVVDARGNTVTLPFSNVEDANKLVKSLAYYEKTRRKEETLVAFNKFVYDNILPSPEAARLAAIVAPRLLCCYLSWVSKISKIQLREAARKEPDSVTFDFNLDVPKKSELFNIATAFAKHYSMVADELGNRAVGVARVFKTSVFNPFVRSHIVEDGGTVRPIEYSSDISPAMIYTLESAISTDHASLPGELSWDNIAKRNED